jgi:hypothetical protein
VLVAREAADGFVNRHLWFVHGDAGLDGSADEFCDFSI